MYIERLGMLLHHQQPPNSTQNTLTTLLPYNYMDFFRFYTRCSVTLAGKPSKGFYFHPTVKWFFLFLWLPLDGPDMPVLMVSPTKAVFVSGDSLFLSCVAEGLPPPSATWIFSNHSIPASSGGTVNLTDVTTSQSGVYTCVLINQKTGAQMKRNITVHVYGMQF